MKTKTIVIRPDVPAYMSALRQWLADTADTPLEEMSAFFSARLDGYEQHMSAWREAYCALPAYLPPECKTLLDLGCGTGLELDALLAARPDLAVTGVDLSADMLARLKEKHPSVEAMQGDYLRCPLGEARFDAVVSVESLHHFSRDQKHELFRRVNRALKIGGTYIEVDYLACCLREEALLAEECARRRAAQGIAPEQFVHFDTPITPEHECALLEAAGFEDVALADCIAGACFITARRLG